MKVYIVEDTERGIHDGRRLYLSLNRPSEDSPQMVRGELEVTVIKSEFNIHNIHKVLANMEATF